MPGISVMVIPKGENFMSTSGGLMKDMSMPLIPGARENRCRPISMRPLMLTCVTATLPETRGSKACALMDGAICNTDIVSMTVIINMTAIVNMTVAVDMIDIVNMIGADL